MLVADAAPHNDVRIVWPTDAMRCDTMHKYSRTHAGAATQQKASVGLITLLRFRAH